MVIMLCGVTGDLVFRNRFQWTFIQQLFERVSGTTWWRGILFSLSTQCTHSTTWLDGGVTGARPESGNDEILNIAIVTLPQRSSTKWQAQSRWDTVRSMPDYPALATAMCADKC